MKMFQAPLNRSLNSIAEKTIEVGKELMGKHDAGSRIQLLAFVDELNFALEAYKNLCFYLQVNSVTAAFGQRKNSVRASRDFAGAPTRHAVFTARQTAEKCLIHHMNKLLTYLRDDHNLPVGELLDEVFCVTTPLPQNKTRHHQRFRQNNFANKSQVILQHKNTQKNF
jgi:hypothetical protein